MKFEKPVKLSKMASLLKATFIGDPKHKIEGINEIHRVQPGDITFVDVEKYYKKALESAATTIIINKEITPPEGKAIIISEDPFKDFNYILEEFSPRVPTTLIKKPKLHDTVLVGKNVTFGRNVKIGQHVEIGSNVSIGHHVSIGDYSIIYPNTTIYDNVTIGKHVIIQSNSVIGSEAFYYKKREWGREKMLSKGGVIIEDFVEIGANTTIGEHTKIDNLVQIGHDTIIGKRCLIAAQVGIAGCVNIEDDVILWGQSGVPSDVTIGKGAILMAKSGAMSSLEGGKVYLGFVAKERMQFLRELAAIQNLPKLIQQFNEKK
jgi:UDP-3-O-[3-hydroxymyristoyl] glucosamine N-acyltransferase